MATCLSLPPQPLLKKKMTQLMSLLTLKRHAAGHATKEEAVQGKILVLYILWPTPGKEAMPDLRVPVIVMVMPVALPCCLPLV